jgi:hypothetical protein
MVKIEEFQIKPIHQQFQNHSQLEKNLFHHILPLHNGSQNLR